MVGAVVGLLVWGVVSLTVVGGVGGVGVVGGVGGGSVVGQFGPTVSFLQQRNLKCGYLI